MCVRPPSRRFPGGSRRHPFRFGTLPIRPLAIPTPRPLQPSRLTPWFDGEPADDAQAAAP